MGGCPTNRWTGATGSEFRIIIGPAHLLDNAVARSTQPLGALFTFMAESYVYDKAKYHYDGNFPDDLEPEQGFVHTGLFLGWIVDHDLYDTEWFGPEMRSYIDAFKNRELTGPKLFETCDGVFLDDMLTPEGNAFAKDYFEFEGGKFLADYGELLAKGLPSMYHVSDTWANYEKLKKRIDQRYRDWKGETSGGWRSFFRKRG